MGLFLGISILFHWSLCSLKLFFISKVFYWNLKSAKVIPPSLANILAQNWFNYSMSFSPLYKVWNSCLYSCGKFHWNFVRYENESADFWIVGGILTKWLMIYEHELFFHLHVFLVSFINLSQFSVQRKLCVLGILFIHK